MTSQSFTPIAPRPAPVKTEGLLPWLRANLFHDWSTSLATVIIGGLLLWTLPQVLQWALADAVWRPDLTACDAEGAGACWGVLTILS